VRALTPSVQRHALAHGMSTAFALAALFDVVTLLLIVALIRVRPVPGTEVEAVPASSGELPARPR
jgi:hypothetical protein